MRFSRLPARTRIGATAAVISATVIVIALGVLLYRWNEEASDATGLRLADALQLSVVNWHLDLFRNLSEVSLTLRARSSQESEVSSAELEAQLAEWRSIARYPTLIAGLYIVDRQDVRRVAAAAASVPPDIAQIVSALRDGVGEDAVVPDRLFTESFYNIGSALRDWRFEPSVPALVRAIVPGESWLLVELDETVLRRQILPDLAHRYFQGIDGLDYEVAVVAYGAARRVIYTSDPGFGDDEVPDADARMDVLATTRDTLRIFHKTTFIGGPAAAAGVSWFPLLQSSDRDRDWQLVVRHRRGGSLGLFVTTMRRRGLALSYGALGLLVLSMSMLVVTGIRAHRLGRLQMDFVTAVSHELRTPLTIIGSAADNLNDGVIESQEQVREYGSIISREVGTLTGLIERVLLFVSTRDRRHRYLLEPVDVAAVVEEVVTNTGALVKSAGVALDVHVEPDLAPALADRVALAHCLENLVTNALKYGASGGTLRISATAAPGHQRPLIIGVRDEGPGIDAADLPEIFEPFYRSASARAAQIHGTGLGLALVRQMVSAMDGTIAAESAPGRGALFTIRLRAAAA